MKFKLLLISFFLCSCNIVTNSNASLTNSSLSSTSSSSTSSSDSSSLLTTSSFVSNLDSSSYNPVNTHIDYELYEDSNLSPYGKIIKSNSSFTYKLPEPSELISSRKELKYALEYHAFYQDSEFELNLKDSYSKMLDVDYEKNYQYWYTTNINGVMGFDMTHNGNKLKVQFIHYDYGTRKSADSPYYTLLDDVAYKENDFLSENLDYDFTLNLEGEPVEVYNTQQLYYAIDNNYKPICLPNSPSEKYLMMANDVLRKIIKDDFSEYEKVKNIYDYIIHNAYYDYAALDHSNSTNPDLYPDQECAYYDCYFLEGFFDNKRVVCDSFAKTYTLLASLAKIEIHRAAGGDGNYSTRAVAGHAYCYVRVDNKWYLSCPTWAGLVYDKGEYIGVLTHDYFLTTRSVMSSYACTYYTDLVMNEKYDYYGSETFNYNGREYNKCIRDKEELESLASSLEKGTFVSITLKDFSIYSVITKYKIEFNVFGNDGLVMYKLD